MRKRSPVALLVGAVGIVGASVAFLSNLAGARDFVCSAGVHAVCSPKSSDAAELPRPPSQEWDALENETTYARNFQRRERRPFERFEQVVTVYETPMADDRRSGIRLSPTEYLEIFRTDVASDYVVMQVRVDKGRYWLLSRQSLMLSADLSAVSPEVALDRYRFHFQNQIDETRHFLLADFEE